jgi:membrane protein DedA with SNARE-associated domain
MLSSLAHWVQDQVAANGLQAVFWLTLLGNACIPIPSEVTMVYAGYLVSQGTLVLWQVVLVGTVASLVGSWLAWAAGWYGVDSVLVRSDRSRRHMTQAHDWFARYGAPTVFLSRMVPVVRTFISLPAGIARMPLLQFSIYTAAGSFIWCLLLTVLGDQAGSNWGEWHRRIGYLNYVVVLAAVALAAAWLLRRRRRTQV